MSQKAFLVGTNRYSFRSSEPAEIIGVVFVAPEDHAARACYHIRFHDGVEDFVALSGSACFKIISEDDVLAGRLPEVVD